MASQVMTWVVFAWVCALIALVAFKTLTGQINLAGLLSHSRPSDGRRVFSPERAQLLLAALAGAIAYAQSALAAGKMVEPSTITLSGIAGSQTLYVAGKYLRHLLATRP